MQGNALTTVYFKDTFIKTVETHYSILKGRLKQKDQTQKFYDLQLSKIYSSFINSIFSNINKALKIEPSKFTGNKKAEITLITNL